MRDEGDPARIDRRILQQTLQPVDDPCGDALGRAVGRRNFDARDHLARRRIDRDDVGKRSPNVDADAKRRQRRHPRNGAPRATVSVCFPRVTSKVWG